MLDIIKGENVMFSVKLSEIIKTLKLEKLYCPDEMFSSAYDIVLSNFLHRYIH